MTTTTPPTAPQATELPDIPSPGSIVQVRGREWVTLPQSRTEKQDQVLRLRPLGGGDQTIATLFWPLEADAVKPASFALPDPACSGSQSSALLLRDALLLKLRAGAGPFRCLGNVALEPRPYQLVPLLMALKQEVSRVLIADEVGLGKTQQGKAAGVVVLAVLEAQVAAQHQPRVAAGLARSDRQRRLDPVLAEQEALRRAGALLVEGVPPVGTEARADALQNRERHPFGAEPDPSTAVQKHFPVFAALVTALCSRRGRQQQA